MPSRLNTGRAVCERRGIAGDSEERKHVTIASLGCKDGESQGPGDQCGDCEMYNTCEYGLREPRGLHGL